MLEVFLKVLFGFLSVGLIGGLLGFLLSYASKILAVKKDERIAALESVLPDLNCGSCGYAGCAVYAEALANGECEDITLCAPGGEDTLTGLSTILGIEAEANANKQVAQVLCRGSRETAEYGFNYKGLNDCNALYLLYEGDKVCKFGCLGKGSCIKVCPVDAIYYDKENLVVVDEELCITCGKCMDICPTGVLEYVPYGADYIVACNSRDKGGAVRKFCKVGCIGCKICVKNSEEGMFNIEHFLAKIDYTVEGSKETAAEKCPPKCIIPTPRKK